MVVYSEKVYEKDFSDEISKKAYLDACKWLATEVIGKGNLSEYVTFQIRKQAKTKKPTFKVTLFVTIKENEIKREYCKKCQQMHTIFYCVDKPKCDECRITGYEKILDSHIKGIRKILEGELNAEGEWK